MSIIKNKKRNCFKIYKHVVNETFTNRKLNKQRELCYVDSWEFMPCV